MYQLSAYEKIRLQCQAREYFERLKRSNRHAYEEAVSENAALKAENTTLQKEITRLHMELEVIKQKESFILQ